MTKKYAVFELLSSTYNEPSRNWHAHLIQEGYATEIEAIRLISSLPKGRDYIIIPVYTVN